MSACCSHCHGTGDEAEMVGGRKVVRTCFACNGSGGWNEIDQPMTAHTGGSPAAVALVNAAARRERGF